MINDLLSLLKIDNQSNLKIMKKNLIQFAILLAFISITKAQTNPGILSWIQNNDGTTGRHYIAGNSTPIEDDVLANVQSVDYSNNWVYVTATGIPSYITGPVSYTHLTLPTKRIV